MDSIKIHRKVYFAKEELKKIYEEIKGKLLDINLEQNEKYIAAVIKNVEEGSTYVISTQVQGIKGEPYSAYFGIMSLKEKLMVEKKCKWLNDCSGNDKQVSLVFKANSDKIRILYSINNTDTPTRANCHY